MGAPLIYETAEELAAAHETTIRQLRGDLKDAMTVIDAKDAEIMTLLSTVRILSNRVEIC
jgi:ferric iron reductase protein FhuF